MYLLRSAAASDAFHDSAERYPQPRCHPETRTKMLGDLYKWSSETDPNSSVLWLHGPAGAGKSAIAQSFCQKLEAEGRLGASFFFKRGHPSRGTGNRLFPTAAYQLALCLPELKRAISQIVEDNPSILERAFCVQLQKLITEPSQQIVRARTLIIVIDGLDECEGQDIQQEILHSIGTHVKPGALPPRFLVASRPEPHIREMFESAALTKIHRPVNMNQSFDDVRKYLFDEFARIHREHPATMSAVSFPWPSKEIIDNLVSKSSGYFIYASTVIKFIDDKNCRPTKRLDAVVGVKQPGSGSPFAALDQLYTQILSEAHDRPRLLRILTVIVVSLGLSLYHMEQLLELDWGDVRLALHGLHSVIYFDREDASSKVFIHHASFRDFLQDSGRAGEFHVGDPQRTDLCRHLLHAFSYTHEDYSWNRRGHVSW
ncbi:hypothetical protein B0H13DRAFT_1634626 [Mycena leptocephala]|nr:hypothetical protein B0H13DRAFT_1634626 [Mycena leptocephala]